MHAPARTPRTIFGIEDEHTGRNLCNIEATGNGFAKRLGPHARVVTLMADSGLKYLSTNVYKGKRPPAV